LYSVLKYTHLACIFLTAGLFLVRGIWMMRESPRLQRKWVRIVPHVIDTILLASAIGLMIVLGQYPFFHGWLTAKFFGLIAYISLGSIALSYGRTRSIRIVAFVMALCTFAYIIAVARYHTPWPVPLLMVS